MAELGLGGGPTARTLTTMEEGEAEERRLLVLPLAAWNLDVATATRA